jgi:hypothetical protein
MQRFGPWCAGACCAAVTFTGLAVAPVFAAQAHQSDARLTAGQIAQKANADFAAATSVRTYKTTSGGGITISVSKLLTRQGCLASIDTSGLSVSVLKVGSSEWIKPSNQFWQMFGYTGTELADLEGKWVTESAFESALGGSGLNNTIGDCDIQSSITGVAAKNWTLDKTVRISGQWAWQLSTTEVVDKQKLAVDGYVSDGRTPEWLRFTRHTELSAGQHGEASASLTEYFSDYNAPATLSAPAAADVLTSIPTPPGPASSSFAGAGNPLAGQSADQIAREADADLKAARSVHIYGSGNTGALGSGTISITATRQACLESIDLNKYTMRSIEIGNTEWTQLTAQYLREAGVPAAKIASLEGKWLKTSTEGDNGDFSGACGTEQLGLPGTGTPGQRGSHLAPVDATKYTHAT